MDIIVFSMIYKYHKRYFICFEFQKMNPLGTNKLQNIFCVHRYVSYENNNHKIGHLCTNIVKLCRF